MTENEEPQLAKQIASDIVKAIKAKDQATLAPLRMLKAALVNHRVEKRRELDNTEAVKVVMRLVKQRQEAKIQFAKGGREDLVNNEAAEICVLQSYLPPSPEPEKIQAAVQAAMKETGATSSKDFGRVMKAAMTKLADLNVDGKTVNKLVKEQLGDT